MWGEEARRLFFAEWPLLLLYVDIGGRLVVIYILEEIPLVGSGFSQRLYELFITIDLLAESTQILH